MLNSVVAVSAAVTVTASHESTNVAPIVAMTAHARRESHHHSRSRPTPGNRATTQHRLAPANIATNVS